MKSSRPSPRLPEAGTRWKANVIQEANTTVRGRTSFATIGQPIFSITTQTATAEPGRSLDQTADGRTGQRRDNRPGSSETSNRLKEAGVGGGSTPTRSGCGTIGFPRFSVGFQSFPTSQAKAWEAGDESGTSLFRKSSVQEKGSSSESNSGETTVQNFKSSDFSQPPLPDRAQRSPSAPWSSDSDNRLIKGLNTGKSIDVLRKEFPARNQIQIERRRRDLVARGVFGQANEAMAPEQEAISTPTGHHKPTAGASGGFWLESEDAILIAGVKAGETTETTAQRLPARSIRALQARMIRLANYGKITEAERLASAHSATTSPASLLNWTCKEDEMIIQAHHDKKTADEVAQMFSGRTKVEAIQRRIRLIVRNAERNLSLSSSASEARLALAEATSTQMVAGRPWTDQEDSLLRILKNQQLDWESISSAFNNRSQSSVSNRWIALERRGLTDSVSGAPQPGTPSSVPVATQTNPDNSTSGKSGQPWTEAEDRRLIKYVQQGHTYRAMVGLFGTRSLGSLANRQALLLKRGKIKPSNLYQASSDASFVNGRDGLLDMNKSDLRRKALPDFDGAPTNNKRPHQDDSDDASSEDDSIQIQRHDRPRQNPHHDKQSSISDSHEDENEGEEIQGSSLHRTKCIRTFHALRSLPQASRGRTRMRGISRPVSTFRQQAAAPLRTNRRTPSLPGASNSIDRLSNAFTSADDAEDTDTIYVSNPQNPRAVGSQSAARSDPRGKTSILSESVRKPPSQTSASDAPIPSSRDLDETLIAQQEEIEALEARLAMAKQERVESQAERIVELHRQLKQFDTKKSSTKKVTTPGTDPLKPGQDPLT